MQLLKEKGSFAADGRLVTLLTSDILTSHIKPNKSIQHLSKIHVERNYDLYRSPQICQWFREALLLLSDDSQVIDGEAVKGSFRHSLRNDFSRVRGEMFDSEINYYRYSHSDHTERRVSKLNQLHVDCDCRHLDFLDFSDSTQAIQEEEEDAGPNEPVQRVNEERAATPNLRSSWVEKHFGRFLRYPIVHFFISMFFEV